MEPSNSFSTVEDDIHEPFDLCLTPERPLHSIFLKQGKRRAQPCGLMTRKELRFSKVEVIEFRDGWGTGSHGKRRGYDMRTERLRIDNEVLG